MNFPPTLRSLFFAAFMLFSILAKSQEEQGTTYVILNKGSVSNIQPYIDALNKANMHNHRLRDKRYTITFDTGVTVQLFSATEMKANGKQINPEDYPEEFDSQRVEPAFSLGANNFIMEMHYNRNKTTNQ